MKVYKKMHAKLKPFYQNEMAKAAASLKKEHFIISWRHLERAHILAQPYPVQHTVVHWQMFLFGIKVKNWKEVRGQIPRLLFGGVKSFVGYIPFGNTGRANVPPLQPMEIPEDLQVIINNTKTK